MVYVNCMNHEDRDRTIGEKIINPRGFPYYCFATTEPSPFFIKKIGERGGVFFCCFGVYVRLVWV